MTPDLPAALAGLRVLDLADESGAYCGKLLADMGADVILVEPPGGSPMRDIGPFLDGRPDRDRSLFFWHYRANTRSVVLDLDAAADRGRFDALLATADVLLLTGSAATLCQRGLDPDVLAARFPQLVLLVISSFGLTGPRREWKSCDTVAQALGGMAFVNGYPDEPPLRALGPQAYHVASLYAAIGALLALRARDRDGAGQRVDISVHESVTATLEHVGGLFHQRGAIARRRGSQHWAGHFRVGRCRDGHILHGTLGDWTSLIEWVKADGKGAALTGPEWDDVDYRRDHADQLFAPLDAWAAEHGVAELADGAQLRRLPYAAVRPVESLPHDAQLQARGFFVPLPHPDLGRAPVYPGAPYRFSATPWRLRRGAPRLGEDAPDVLASLAPAAAPPAALPGPPRGERALAGVRVLDFTWVVAGPVATRILADHGAEVIKIEHRRAPDLGDRRGGLTGNLNRGKRSVVVDMADPRGLTLARDLARRCDLVIDNFSPRVMRHWGLEYEQLRELRPDIISLRMSGFGLTGPHADDVSYGPTLQALSGWTLAMRHPGREPAGWGFSYADMIAGYHAALAALIALRHRARTGEGQSIDLSQFEAVVAAIGPTLLDVLVNASVIGALGNRSPERPAAPHGLYRCRDTDRGERWCAICVFTDDEWARFAQAIGGPAWTREPRFATLDQRYTRRDELDALVESWTSHHEAEGVADILQAAGIAAGIVADAEDLCRRDPQLAARGYWTRIDTRDGAPVTLDGVPVRLSRTPGFVAAPGPLLGEDTDAVLRDVLGLDHNTVARLRNEQVVA